MTRDRLGLIRSRLDRARRHPGRSETSRTVNDANQDESCKRVSGALAASVPGNDLPLGNDPMAAAEIIGESHGAGLNVVWTVLCNHRRLPPPR
jgi:hypothetical protein